MSEIGDEFESKSTDDFGYKSLGESIQLVTDYEEKLAFKHINNLAYTTQKDVFVAAGSDKIVLGTLKDLKTDISNNEEIYKTNRHELKIQNVTSVGFTRDEKSLILSSGRSLMIASFSDYTTLTTTDFKNIGFDEEVDFFLPSPANPSKIAVLSVTGNLTIFDSSTQSNDILAKEVLNLSWSPKGKQIVITQHDGSIRQITLTGEVKVTIPRPDDLADENLLPLSIVWISVYRFFAVFGELPQENHEDEPSYDFKTFIITHDKSSNQNIFQENFDLIPAFGSVLRKPTVYSHTFLNLSNSLPTFTVTASSTSVEVSGISDKEVILPELDQARAALPINENTGNDINAIGLIADINATGKIEEPCVGVSEAGWLPSVWVLGNDGKVQGWYVFHVHDLKNGSFKQDAVKQHDDDMLRAALEAGTTTDTPVKTAAAPTIVPSQPENKPFSFGASSAFGASAENKPEFGSSFGKPDDKTSGFGSSGFGQASFGSNTGSSSGFGSSGFGQKADTGSAFGSSGFGSSGFGQKADTGSGFGSSGFGQKTDKSSGFGSSGFGQTKTDTSSAFGSSGFGSSGFGQKTDTGSGFGSSGFGQTKTDTSSGFGSSGFGQTKTDTSSGFGSSGFGQKTDTSSGFGSSGFGQSAFGGSKPAFGSSGFSQASGSPFANLSNQGEKKSDSPFGKSLSTTEPKSESPFSAFAKQGEKTESSFASFGKSDEISPFAKFGTQVPTKSDSPFSTVTQNESSAPVGFSTGPTQTTFGSKEGTQSSLFGGIDENKSKPNKPFVSFSDDLGSSLAGATTPSKVKIPGLSDDEDYNSDNSDSDKDSDKEEQEQEQVQEQNQAPTSTGPTSFGNVSFNNASAGPTSFGSSGFGSNAFGSSGFGNTGFKLGQQPQKPLGDESKGQKVETFNSSGFGQFATDNKFSELSKGKNIFEGFKSSNEESTKNETTKELEADTAKASESFRDSPVDESEASDMKDDFEANPTVDADDFAKFQEEADKEWIDSEEGETENEHQSNDEDEVEAGEGNEEKSELDEGEEVNDTTEYVDSSFDKSEVDNQTQDDADKLGEEIDEALTLNDDAEDSVAHDLGDDIDKNLNISDDANDVPQDNEYDQSKDEHEFEDIKAEDGKDSSSLESLRDKEEEDLYEEVKGQNVNYDGAERVERSVQVEGMKTEDVNTQTFVPTRAVGVSAATETREESVQTGIIETKSIALKTFEDDEAYFSSFFVPPEVPAYQHLSDVKYPKLSSDPIFSQLEKIYYDTQAEISIIEENCTNIGLFLDEHLKEEPVHTEKSLGNAHHWRLSEAGKVHEIIVEKSKDSAILKKEVTDQYNKIKSVQDDIDKLEKQTSEIRGKFLTIEKLTDKAILNARDLPVEVLVLQDKIRKKHSKVSSDLRASEQKIMSLKTATNIFYNEAPTPAALHGIINHINSITRDYSKETKNLSEQIAQLNVNHAKILEQLNEGKTKSFEENEWQHRSVTKLKVEDLSKRLNIKRAINAALRERSANSITYNV